MDSGRWETIQALFHGAADLPRAAQRDFLKASCAGDETLISDVLAMLGEDARGASLLDRDLAELADRVMGEGVPRVPSQRRFGPYRLTHVLGEGGMGVVYHATRDDLGSTAAIKILRDASLSPARRERFASEQRILAQLNHPAIARLYDADTLADGTPWFVMEYVQGVPLTEYCRTRTTSIAGRLRLFRDVCDAVQHAHGLMVVHRDLKPSNILVTPDGGVKLLDFGISKQLDVLDAPRDSTLTGLRLMTRAYAAPEQIRGSATGVHTDVYALGVILYEIVAGRAPFDLSDLTPAEAERMVVDVDPPKPSAAAKARTPRSFAPGAHGWADLDVLCLTAMHKDPERRYRTVESLIRDVDHYLRGEPLEARPDSLPYRTAKFVRRNWRPLTAVAAVLTVIVSMTGFYTSRLAIARDAAVAEAIRTERIQRFMLNLFDGGEREAGPADGLRVVTLVDRGVIQAGLLDREPLVQAELNQTLGSIYQSLGKFEQADALLRSSLDQRRFLLGPNAADVVRGQVALALLRSDQARFDEAERLGRETLTTARTTMSPDDPLIATAASALGEILHERGKYDEAIAVLEDAVRLRSAPGTDPSELAATLFELASAHFYAGHLDLSESLNHQVLAMHRELLGERHPHVAEALVNLGAIQHERGHYGDAERFYRQALDINQSWYGKESYRTGSTMTMLGRALGLDEKYDEARELLHQALAIQEHVFGAVHPRVASALNDLGNVAMRRNRPDEAEPFFRRIGDIYRAVYGDTHYLVGIAVSNLAGVYLARNDHAAAEQMFREAVTLFTDAQSADHLNTGIARIKLGRTLLRQERHAEAEREVLAGYQIVAKQAAPTVSWLKAAREDLVAIYDTLGDTARAQKFRLEAAQVAEKSP